MATPEPKLRDFFSKAVQYQNAQEQAAYLEQVCQGDADLRARLEDLLQAQREIGSFLQEPSASRGDTVDEPPISERPGRQLESRHRAGIEGAQHPHFGIAEAKLCLPQWQEHVEQVGKPVMQRMRPTRDRHGAAFGRCRNPTRRVNRYLRQWPIRARRHDKGVIDREKTIVSGL